MEQKEKHSFGFYLAEGVFIFLLLFVATWYYRCILLLLAATMLWKNEIRTWCSQHMSFRYSYAAIVITLSILIILLMPKPHSMGRVKLYYQTEQGEHTQAPWLQVVCNALLPEEEIQNVGIHAAVIGGSLGDFSFFGVRLNNRFVKMAQQDALHGKIFNFYSPCNALERNLNTPMSGVYAQAFEQWHIQHSQSVYVIRPKHFDPNKHYPLVVFCHGYLGNWQLYQGIWRDLDECIVLSLGTKNLSGIYTNKDIQSIWTKQIPFLESLGYHIDPQQVHLIGISNGGSACRIAYNSYGNRFKSITAISTGCAYTEYGHRTCQVNLIGGNDCSTYPKAVKQFRAMGVDAQCLYDVTYNHYILVHQRKRILQFINDRLQ